MNEELDEIAERYEEAGFFKRFTGMLSGLGKPHDTREYKLARIELQRLSAPIAAAGTAAASVCSSAAGRAAVRISRAALSAA